MKKIVQGANFHYVQVSRGKPVLLLHGFTLDHRSIKAWCEPVFRRSPSTYRRIYPDLPGMGKSRFKGGIASADRMLEVLLEFVKKVIGSEPFLIVGSSYGGYLARGLLHRLGDQIDGMALLCPVVVADKDRRILPPMFVIERNETLRKKVEGGGDENEKETFSFLTLQRAKVWKRCLEEILPGTRACDPESIRSMERHYGFTFEHELTDRFEKPVLLLTGRHDTLVGYRDSLRLLDLYPRASFLVLDRAGHNLPIEQPRIFEALLQDWIESY